MLFFFFTLRSSNLNNEYSRRRFKTIQGEIYMYEIIKLLYSDLRTPYRMVYSGKKARACRLESRYCRNTPAAARAPSGR